MEAPVSTFRLFYVSMSQCFILTLFVFYFAPFLVRPVDMGSQTYSHPNRGLARLHSPSPVLRPPRPLPSRPGSLTEPRRAVSRPVSHTRWLASTPFTPPVIIPGNKNNNNNKSIKILFQQGTEIERVGQQLEAKLYMKHEKSFSVIKFNQSNSSDTTISSEWGKKK